MSPTSQAASGKSSPVVLVNMPFSPLQYPSLALGLMKGALRDVGIPSQVLYFHLNFAKQIGLTLYDFICSSFQGSMSLSGDWLFSHTLFENKPDDVQAYVSTVLRKRHPAHPLPWDELERNIAGLLVARMFASSFVDTCVDTLLATDARIVGFTSVFQQNVAALAVAQRLKRKRPELVTIFGGSNFEGVMGKEQFKHFPFVDIIVSGEAEKRFPRVVERLLQGERLGPLANVYVRDHLAGGAPFADPGEVMLRDMDSQPIPDLSDFFKQWEAADLKADSPPYLMFESSRGCWWGQKQHCTFCGLNGESMTYRSKSPERALSEFTALTEAYPGLPVYTVDNILDKKYFKTFIQDLATRNSQVELFYEVKSNLTREQLRLLKAARVMRIQPGIESLSDQVLRIMRKGVTGMHNLQLLKWCKEFGITPQWNILWGFPGEEPVEYARMAELLPLLTHLTPPLTGLSIILERFSPNFNEAKALGFKNVRPSEGYFFTYALPGEALHNMAYFFSYEYQEERNVWSYVNRLSKHIWQWKDEHGTSALYAVDKEDHLLIFDTRKVAPRPRVTLTGAERWALLACDGAIPLEKLKARYLEEDPASRGWDSLESVLSRLAEARLLVSDGKSCLGLPILVTGDPLAAPVSLPGEPAVSHSDQAAFPG